MNTADDDRNHMITAIELAKSCSPSEDRIPRVGAVIAIGSEVIGSGKRGDGKDDDDHAEWHALKSVHDKSQLSEATVYTTLEPCTADVRSQGSNACTERILNSGIKRAFIGILDPNQGVTGKGLLRLQTSNVDVELFPPDLASKIRSINDDFIRSQRDYGIKIHSPRNGAKVLASDGIELTIKGQCEIHPGEEVFAVCRWGDEWWPQRSDFFVEGKNWETKVLVTGIGAYHLYIVKASLLGIVLIDYYRQIIKENERREEVIRRVMMTRRLHPDSILKDENFAGRYPGIKILGRPKGWEILDQISITRVSA
jgi:pyrimidine deaminase RibD-like protein